MILYESRFADTPLRDDARTAPGYRVETARLCVAWICLLYASPHHASPLMA
jgi:hypothetical protein